MNEAEQRLQVALARIQVDLGAVATSDGDPYESTRRVWSEAMSAAPESHDVMWPLWLLWGALTDWVEGKPDQAAAAESLCVVQRASG